MTREVANVQLQQFNVHRERGGRADEGQMWGRPKFIRRYLDSKGHSVIVDFYPKHLDLTRNFCSKACCSNWAKCALEKEDVLQASCPLWRYKLQATAVAKEHINYSFFAYRRRLEWFRIYLRLAMRKLLTQMGHVSP